MSDVDTRRDDTDELAELGFEASFMSPKDRDRGIGVDTARILSRVAAAQHGPAQIIVFVVTLRAPNRQRFDRVVIGRTTQGHRPLAFGIDGRLVEGVADALDGYIAEREDRARRLASPDEAA